MTVALNDAVQICPPSFKDMPVSQQPLQNAPEILPVLGVDRDL